MILYKLFVISKNSKDFIQEASSLAMAGIKLLDQIKINEEDIPFKYFDYTHIARMLFYCGRIAHLQDQPLASEGL